MEDVPPRTILLVLLVGALIVLHLLILVSIPDQVAAYTPRSPIFINGNSNLTAANGVTGGDGTPTNPYIIEGWEIDASSSDGIVIRYTNLHFVVRNVYVHSTAGAYKAINLYRVEHGSVRNVSAANSGYGVYVDTSVNVTILGNNVSGNQYGIYLSHCSNLGASGNSVFSSSWHGVYVGDSALVDLSANSVSANKGGFYLVNSTSVKILNNSVSSNSDYGILMAPSGNPLSTVIADNDISRSYFGITLDGATGVRVYHNNFVDNTMQAFDGRSTENDWDNGCLSGGNYWSDYSGVDGVDCATGQPVSDGLGDSPYVIDADSRDNYPLMRPWQVNQSNNPPSASFFTPTGGEDWSGGSQHIVSWSMSDDLDNRLYVWINCSLDGGADGYPYVVFAGVKNVGSVATQWTPPLVNSTTAALKIVVRDSFGASAVNYSVLFTVDSAPPTISASTPSNNSLDANLTKEIRIVFDEAVDRTSAELAFSIAPSPGNVSFSWTRTGLGEDVLNVSHASFVPETKYTVTFSTLLQDVSDPGNHPRGPLMVRFSTLSLPVVQPPVARASAKTHVLIGEIVTLNGSGSTGVISSYVWTIEDSQGNVVGTRSGMVVTYTFGEARRYFVTLNVTDEGTGLSDTDTLEIVVSERTVTPGGVGVTPGVVVVTAAIVVIILAGGIEALRVPLMTALFVLAYRRKSEGKEETETRGMVRGYIVINPGDTYTEIKRGLRMSNGSLTWHLMKLEKDGVVRSRVRGTRKRYYPSDMPVPAETGGELHEIQRRLLDAIAGDPGKPVKVLAEELGVSSQLALYHLRKLSHDNLVILERRALRLRAFPASVRKTRGVSK